MLQIRNVAFTNVCQFKSADVSFAPGMTGVLGRNGYGKSNFLNMLYAALTGDFTCNAGTKDLNIYGPVRDDKKAVSKIDVEFNVGTTPVHLTRALRGAKTRLVVGDAEPLYGDLAVTAEICRLLQVSVDLLADHIFVRQGEIYRGVFDGRETERLKALQQLFQLEWAQTCYQSLTRRLSALPAIQSIDLDMLRSRTAIATEDLQALVEQQQAIPVTKVAAQQHIDDAHCVLALHKQRLELRDEIKQLDTRIAGLEQDCRAAEAQLAEEVVVDDAELYAERDQLCGEITAWEAYTRGQRAVHAYQARCEELAVMPEAPIPPKGYQPSAAVREQITVIPAYASERAVLRRFDGGVAVCPTCNREVDEAFTDIIAQYRQAIADADAMTERLRAAITTSTQYEKTLSAWETDCALQQQRLDEHTRRGAPVVPAAPARSVAELEERLDAVRAVIADNKRNRDAYAASARELERQRGRLLQCEQDRQRTAAELAGLPEVLPADVTHANSDIEYCTQLLEQHTLLDGRISEARRNLRTCEVQLEDSREAMMVQAVTTAQRARLEQLRGAVHPNALPRLFTQKYMHELTVEINSLLEAFQVPFTVGIADGLTMFAQHSDGTRDTVQRLSGGQKVVLALGFRVAVYRRFARHVGLLVLDEPTEYLDKENVDCLLTALDKIREMVDSDNMQCLVVTHESRLHGTFDKTLLLPAAGVITTMD